MNRSTPSVGILSFFFAKETQLKKESKFQADLIRDLKLMLPGCMVLKNDPNYIQGIPDLLVLYGPQWAAIECKRSENETKRHNQDYYVGVLDKMSYSSFIYPENKKVVLHEIQQTFRPRRAARVSKR